MIELKMFLRPLDPLIDGPALHTIFGNPDCCTWLPDPAFENVAVTTAKLREWTSGFETTSWVVTPSPDGAALGRIALYNTGRDKNIWEAACMIAPTARGQNLATRGLATAIKHLFATTTARRVFADIDPDNHASQRTFEKLGFTREGLLRGEWETHIGIRDTVIYGLLRSDTLGDVSDPLTIIER